MRRMESCSLTNYIAGLDKDPALNVMEELIVREAEKIIAFENPSLDCSQTSQACYEKGKALIESITGGVRFTPRVTTEQYERFILEQLTKRSASLPKTPPRPNQVVNQPIETARPKIHEVILKTMDGQDVPLDLFFHEGKLVVIVFWATWCAPCIKEIPELNEAQKLYHDRISVISIALEPTPSRYSEGLERLHMVPGQPHYPNYPVFIDTDKSIYRLFFPNGGGVPRTLIYGSEGNQLFMQSGYAEEWLSTTLTTLIAF